MFGLSRLRGLFAPRSRRVGKPTGPGDFARLVARGDAARDAGRFDEAREAYRAALAERPAELGIGVQLGHALKETGDLDGAEREYRRFLSVHPLDADIHLQIGDLFARRGEEEEAEQWRLRAAELAAYGSATARDASRAVAESSLRRRRKRALALTDAGDFAAARPELEALLADGQTELAGVLGNVCKELGDFAAARRCYERGEASARDEATRFDLDIQIGHLEKIARDYPAALARFASARARLAALATDRARLRELDREIESSLARITRAVALTRAPD